MSRIIEDFIYSAPAEQTPASFDIQGSLPDYVRGTYYLNGPARFYTGEIDQKHWLDGDGMARALVIQPDSLHYTGKYVRTEKFNQESEAGKPLYRTFGTAFDGDVLRKRLTIETPANVSLYLHGGRLLAFGEQSLPWELDPITLETRGEWNFGGSYSKIAPFSAHPKIDPLKEELHTFGITYFGRRGKLFYYGFDADYQQTIKGESLLKDGNYIHDFALSGEYACFHLAPYSLDIHRFIKEEVSLLDAMQWDENGGHELRIFSRSTGDMVAAIPLPRKSFCLHSINAWEKNGDLLLDLVDTQVPFFDQYLARPHMFTDIHPCSAVRYRINTSDWTISETITAPSEMHYDFPSIGASSAMKPYRYFWAAAMPAAPAPTPKFYNHLFRFDWQAQAYAETWQASDDLRLGGEPMFIENPQNPEEGIILSQCFSLTKETSSYLFFDAFDLNKGPVAKADLPFYDPVGFHTSWVSA